MVLPLAEVRQVIERACSRPEVLDALARQDLGTVVTVLGAHGLTQGQVSAMTGISQGRLSEWSRRKRRPQATATFERFAAGLGLPAAARQALASAAARPAAELPPAEAEEPQSPGDVELGMVTAMSLHSLTTMYGEAGLRARLAAELAQLPGTAEQQRCERALDLAARLHAADRRQREPYLNHLLRVSLRIMCHYRVTDPDLICAALLHDSVEDHAAELSPAGRDEALRILASRFGARTAELVAAVTNPERVAGTDRNRQYRDHVARSLDASPWARVIKVSDFTDNGVGLHYTSGPKAAKLARKYAPLLPVLTELVARPDTPLEPAVKTQILGQFLTARQRFDAIIQATAQN